MSPQVYRRIDPLSERPPLTAEPTLLWHSRVVDAQIAEDRLISQIIQRISGLRDGDERSLVALASQLRTLRQLVDSGSIHPNVLEKYFGHGDRAKLVADIDNELAQVPSLPESQPLSPFLPPPVTTNVNSQSTIEPKHRPYTAYAGTVSSERPQSAISMARRMARSRQQSARPVRCSTAGPSVRSQQTPSQQSPARPYSHVSRSTNSMSISEFNSARQRPADERSSDNLVGLRAALASRQAAAHQRAITLESLDSHVRSNPQRELATPGRKEGNVHVMPLAVSSALADLREGEAPLQASYIRRRSYFNSEQDRVQDRRAAARHSVAEQVHKGESQGLTSLPSILTDTLSVASDILNVTSRC